MAAGNDDLSLAEYVLRAAHDLRTPLTAIRGFADVLVIKGDTLAADARAQLLARIAANAAAMDELIAGLVEAAADTSER
jgi:K+-sensing histidine kinase KdpD